MESELEEAHEENRNLKDKIKSLQSILNDVYRTGAILKDDRSALLTNERSVPLKDVRTAPLKDDRNPAKSSSRESSASMASVKSEAPRKNKRDLSPPSKQANEKFEFKKPKPRNQAWS